MSEERKYGINWVDIIIKVILVVLFVLLICWLFPMPKLDTFYDQVFNTNIQTMKTAAKDFYTSDNLPSTIGETTSMTLQEMIDSKLVLEFSDKDGNTCDTTESYVQVTKTLDSEYSLKVSLTCGDDTDYILDTIACDGDCLLSDVTSTSTVASVDATDTDTSTTSSSSSSTTSGSTNGTSVVYYPLSSGSSSTGSSSTTTTNITTTTTTTTTTNIYNYITSGSSSSSKNVTSNTDYITTSGKTLYYQQAKIVKSYGDWIQGSKSGSNIETKTETVDYYYYYKDTSSTSTEEYRTVSYIGSSDWYSGYTYSYELQLTDLSSSVTNVSIITNRFFNSSDYQTYLNERDTNLYMTGNDMLSNSNASASAMRSAALKSGNFTYSLSSPYKSNGVWRVKVTIKILNASGVSSYYDSYLSKSLYYVPVYFKVSYTSGSTTSSRILDTAANASKYSGYSKTYAYSKQVKYYRYVTETVDYNQTKWTTSKSVSGYKYTGVSKYM